MFCRFLLGAIVLHPHCDPGFRVLTHAYGRARYPLEEERDGVCGDPPGGVEVGS
jgi:hypothetical protein